MGRLGWQELGSAVTLTSEWRCCAGRRQHEGLLFRAGIGIHAAFSTAAGLGSPRGARRGEEGRLQNRVALKSLLTTQQQIWGGQAVPTACPGPHGRSGDSSQFSANGILPRRPKEVLRGWGPRFPPPCRPQHKRWR